VHLLALCSFALSQPLLDLMSRHAPVLVAHDLSSWEIAALVAVLLLVPPAVLWGLEAVLGLVSGGLSRALHTLLVALLIAATLLPPLHRQEAITGDVAVALAVGLGAFASVAYTATARIRRLATFLALAPLIFVGAFVSHESIARLLFEPRPNEPMEVQVGSPSPVVFVVFDELPLTSLLGTFSRIDRRRFPSFHRLASRSTWYRNAGTVHSNTVAAVPSLLTGRYPKPGLLPNAADHPDNLFRLLAGHYEMDVTESFTKIWPSDAVDGLGDRGERLRSIASDVGVLYLHILLPQDLARRLPSLTHGWREFRETLPGRRDEQRFHYGRTAPQNFRRSVASMVRGDRPGFWYLHVNLPHRPWGFLPSGLQYHPNTDYGLRENVWEGSEFWVQQAYQRHLLQAKLADRLLGELLDQLEAENLFDETLLVVVSDHGAGFWPQQARRDPARMTHPEDVISIPLFIKRPGQKTGLADFRNAQTIDVLPTLASLLDVEIPWDLDGCSLLDDGCPPRPEKVIFNKEGERLEFSAEIVRRAESLRHKNDWFGASGRRADLFRIGRYEKLIGRPVAGLSPQDDETLSVLLEQEPFLYAEARPDEMAVARLVGVLEGFPASEGRPFVGVVGNGILAAVVPALPRAGGTFFFSVMLPEAARPKRAEDVEVWVFDGQADAPRASRVRFRLASLREEMLPPAAPPDR
jgi:hypothetical protein